MITNARSMACGNCGHGLFRMFTQPRPVDPMAVLMAECDKCKSVSLIHVDKPRLHIGWGEGAEGILTVMEQTS